MTTITTTDYSHLIPSECLLERNPADTSCALRSYDTAYLSISEDGVSFGTRTYYGGDGTPMDEWHQRTLHHIILSAEHGSCLLDVERLRDDLSPGGKLSGLIDRIRAGHSVEWDGSNMVGRLTKDAREASDLVEHHLCQVGYASDADVWDTGTWLGDDTFSRISAETTDTQLAEWAGDAEAAAAADNITLVGGDILDLMTEHRDALRAEQDEGE